MYELVKVQGVNITVVEYMGQPVISLADIDRVHERPRDTANKAFLRHHERFARGKDYFELAYEEWSNMIRHNMPVQKGKKRGDLVRHNMPYQNDAGGHRGKMIFMTMYGYLKLTKPFSDDRAWAVHNVLIDRYFKFAAIMQENFFLKSENLELHRALRGRKRNKVQEADNSEIVKLKKQGLPTSQICEKTGWSPTTVKKHVADARQLGLFDLPQTA